MFAGVPTAIMLHRAMTCARLGFPAVLAQGTPGGVVLVEHGSPVGHPVTSTVAGVNIVEDDPNDMTVGYGGLPNEEGVVELDAAVMDFSNVYTKVSGSAVAMTKGSACERLRCVSTRRGYAASNSRTVA